MAKEKYRYPVHGGYTKVPNALTRWPKIHRSMRYSVYCLILQRYNADRGYAWPSHEHMAETLDLSQATVKRAVSWLRIEGLVRVNRSGRSNQYIPDLKRLDAWARNSAPIGVAHDPNGPTNGVTGDPNAKRPGSPVTHQTGHPCAIR